MPNIFLREKENTYYEWYSYTIKNYSQVISVTKQVWAECRIYERVTYSIKYEQPWTASSSDYFNVALYDAADNSKKCKPKFTYYYAYSDGQVVDKLDVYYSLLKPNNPLIVSFNRRDTNTYNCSYPGLKGLKWFYGYDLGYYSMKRELKVELDDQYKELLKGKRLTFTAGPYSNEDILVNEYDLVNKEFKKHIYTPDVSKRGPYELYSGSLFLDNSRSSGNNLYLKGVANKQFDGVCMYSSYSGLQLFVEFFDGEKITQLRRIGTTDKSQWIELEKPFTYKDDRQLKRILQYIQFCLNKEILVRLDQQGGNTEVRIVDGETTATPKPINEYELSVNRGCDYSEIIDGYVCYTHNLNDYYNVYVKNQLDDLRILGESFRPDVYLELSLTIDNNHIYLFDESGYTSEFLYYNPDKDGNLYVYFLQSSGYGDRGLKPLLFYYNGKAYKQSNSKDHNTYWQRVNVINSLAQVAVTPKSINLKDVLDELKTSSKTNAASTEPPTPGALPTVKPTTGGGKSDAGAPKNDGVTPKNENSTHSFIGGSLGIFLGMLGSAIAIFSFWNKPTTFNRMR
ncbi:conserved hypothetical protein [Theileria orientalis strain Shintoku]|uniref:Uncharacterized protein n=1 Tax=Theileria orientalis strain Shintoku TaxID=869250 RepID=J7MF25_THEOR|nr:conserved hypothetical protein [Theileria orientalis strain Shintoku]BAM42384.1 conserved hypothetical protein [Theileria orientalis strain Shintoku]|eukprot:XP_009692685.1 conserved hypothetical protein [Theileria orientalis strain Shintoku]